MNKDIPSNNSVSLAQLLEFEAVFPNEKRLTIQEYLKGGNRDFILDVATFFLSFKNSNPKYKDNKVFILNFFREANNEFAKNVYTKIYEIEKAGKPVIIINAYSSLKLFESFFKISDIQQSQTESEFEINLFKAYLVINSELIELQYKAFESTKNISKDLLIPMITFCSHYPMADKMNLHIVQIWASQIVKSIYLFEFMEKQDKTKNLLTLFLKEFNCDSWEFFLKRMIALTIPIIKDKNENHNDFLIEVNEKFEENCAFFEKLMVDDFDELDKVDFLTLRKKPILKKKKGVYRIIFNLFLIEKIFKGIYFHLREINNKQPKSYKIGELKSYLGEMFSEKVLSYKVIESVYPTNCIRFSGKELEEMNISGAPDYYVRKGKNILLFESKDFLIPKEMKMSFDFSVYEDIFKNALYYKKTSEGKLKPKAVLQLINIIRKILEQDFLADPKYYYRQVKIYPILLTHDHQYDSNGFNELINHWFQIELAKLKKEGLFISNVQSLSVVNIDSLIFNQAGLIENIYLHELLKLYHENKKHIVNKEKHFKNKSDFDKYVSKIEQQSISKLIPFSNFTENHFIKNNFKQFPPLMKIVETSLFKE